LLSSSSIAVAGVDTNIDSGTANARTAIVHVQGMPPTTSASLLPDPIDYLAGEHREGDMFGFLLDLQQLRGMSAVQRLEYAASKGHLPLLRAVHKMLDEPLWAEEGLTCATYTEASAIVLGAISRIAANNGQLHVLRYLHDGVGCPLDVDTCSSAALGGHLDCLQYAHEHGCLWDDDTCSSASYGGHLICLQYAHEHGCSWDDDTCSSASYGGHLDCLQYAHESGCPWNDRTCYKAAERGHLNCLQYAHEHECPWNSGTCYIAAWGGHLDCLQYAHEHGCSWDASTCYYAVKGGNLDCLQYAHEHGCPWDASTCVNAAKGGHLDCLQYAHEHGCPCDITRCTAEAKGECVAYLTLVAAAVVSTYS
jgi:hypothetical protein